MGACWAHTCRCGEAQGDPASGVHSLQPSPHGLTLGAALLFLSHQPGQAAPRRLLAVGPGSDGSTWGCDTVLPLLSTWTPHQSSDVVGTARPTLPAEREGGRRAL